MAGQAVTVVTCVTYILILVTVCYRLPFSQLYRRLHTYSDLVDKVEAETYLRSTEAQRYFTSLNPQQSRSLYNSRLQHKNLTFAFGIITIHRSKGLRLNDSYGYLLQSASSLDKMLKLEPFFQASVPFICNVDAIPANHFDAVSLYQFMPYTERYGLNSLGMAPIIIPDKNISFAKQTLHLSKYHKESVDYAFCLLSAAALRPQFVILVEEDALAHQDLPLVLEHLLHTRVNLTHSKFLFLKLFFPAKWQGFGFELSKLLDLASMSVVGGSIVSLIYICYMVTHRLAYHKTSRFFLIGCLVTMATCWLVGRQGVNELRRVSKHLYRLQDSEGCCTQAMLYPTHMVTNLSTYIVSNSASHQTDLAIFDFASLTRIQTYQVEPSLFLHVGFHSTLPSSQKHPEEFVLNM